MEIVIDHNTLTSSLTIYRGFARVMNIYLFIVVICLCLTLTSVSLQVHIPSLEEEHTIKNIEFRCLMWCPHHPSWWSTSWFHHTRKKKIWLYLMNLNIIYVFFLLHLLEFNIKCLKIRVFFILTKKVISCLTLFNFDI